MLVTKNNLETDSEVEIDIVEIYEVQCDDHENESKVVEDDDHSENCNSINEYDSEEGEFKCDLCGEGIEDKDDLSLHEMAEGCEFSCIPCGVAYHHEVDLKQHIERHCIKCFDEFYPKTKLEKHVESCKGI